MTISYSGNSEATDRGSCFQHLLTLAKYGKDEFVIYERDFEGFVCLSITSVLPIPLLSFPAYGFRETFSRIFVLKTYDLFFKSLAGDQELTAVFSEEGFSSISSASASFYDSIAEFVF